ncbi:MULTISPECIES: hypothetical protein [unclassified Streptomyces]|uniref:hypothetical protein n=1 Tax=unclassified Streptomyces TaxID=2593676 RepID=UPI00364D7C65
MSSANGLAGVQDVWPTYGYDYGYGTPPVSTPVSTPDVTPVSTPDVTSQLPHMSVLDVSDTVDNFAQSLVHVLQELVEPAAIALGAMSGALLAGRAAMAATGVLAHAAVRAAEEQRCLLRQQDISRDAAQQWESAAFAATRVNARRAVLAGRLARASRGTPPGSPPPPAPVLPPPVRPEGCRLDATREAVAEAERAVERAQAELAAWECATAVADVADPQDTAWQEVLARQRRTVRHRTSGSTPSTPSTGSAERPARPAPVAGAGGPGADEVNAVSTELLTGLPAEATAEDTEPVVTALHYALICARAGDGSGASEHVEEARIFAAEAGRRVRLRVEALTQAAAQLDFLTTEVPSDVEPKPPSDDVVALLRRAVEEGRPLGAADRDRVRAAVDERLEHLEHRCLQRGTEQLLGALSGGASGWHESGTGARYTDHVPPGWEPDHWIRVTVRRDGIDLATHRAGPPSPRDAERCAETKRWAADFEHALVDLGLDCDFRFTSEVVAPGTPDDGSAADSGPFEREHPRSGRRAQDDPRRRHDGPRHRRIDPRGDREGREDRR